MRTNGAPGMGRFQYSGRDMLPVAMVLAIDIIVGLLFIRLGFWVVIGALAAAAATVFLFTSPSALILTVFVAKPIIDMLWFASATVAGVAINAQSLLSVVIAIAALMFLTLKRSEAPRGLIFPMLGVVAMNAWAVIVTPNLAFAAEYFIRIVCGFPLVFVAPAIIEHLPAPRRLLNLFFVVIAVVCVTGLLQPLGLMGYSSFDSGGIRRATGFYYHPWDLARYMIVAIPLLLAMLSDRDAASQTGKWAHWLLLAASLGLVYFTFLKAAWIAVLFQLLFWLMLTRHWGAASGALLLTIVLVIFPLREGFSSVFSDLWFLGDQATRGQALSGRIFLWSDLWTTFKNSGIREVLFGHGFYLPTGESSGYRATHDDYLRVILANGIVGLIAYLSLIVAAVRALRNAVKQLAHRGELKWRIGLAVECLMVAYLLMGLTADPSSYPSLTLTLWLLIGLVIGYAQVEKRGARITGARSS
jgi:hypothetical protein